MTTATLVRTDNRSTRPAAWWGVATLIATEATIFAILIASYLFLRASSGTWPQGGIAPPDLTIALPFSFVLWGSSVPMLAAERAIRRDRQGVVRAALLLSGLMGLAFLAATAKDFADLRFGWRDNAYGSAFYTLVGLHTAHVVVGVAMNAVVQLKAWLGKLSPERHLTLTAFAMYWHFVDAVWLFVFPVAYLSPHWR
ncbi:MAG: heme-copper oxidase subunit III [Acidobacteria bacterium]|nr:heme-copper oxidase subunit III [Acidobacteriota bacterium]